MDYNIFNKIEEEIFLKNNNDKKLLRTVQEDLIKLQNFSNIINYNNDYLINYTIFNKEQFYKKDIKEQYYLIKIEINNIIKQLKNIDENNIFLNELKGVVRNDY